MIIQFCLLAMMSLSCATPNTKDSIDSKDVASIEIQNQTNNLNIPNKIVLNDHSSIASIVTEVNRLTPIISYTPNLKANTGLYSMLIRFNDHSYKHFDINYTIYDGVIIQGNDGLLMNKYYKNNQLEILVLSLFIERK